jgi:hypothetical protein
MPRAISITEPLDLSAFRRPMQLIPARVEVSSKAPIYLSAVPQDCSTMAPTA